MQGDKFENKIFKLLIGGSTASNACSMQGINMKKNIRKIKKYIQFRIFVVKYTSDTK